MAEATKDTIYIDIDDEITSIINKVNASDHKIVALVLPKRATVLQSIVNMKLLKRTADSESKRVVLITSEASVLPLAGAVGLYTAKTTQSKPVIPPPPDVPDADETPVETGDSEESGLDDSKSIGELAGLPDEPESQKEETIDIDNSQPQTEKAHKGKKGAKGTNKKLKVPNFDSFRIRLFLGIGAFILLIVFWVFASKILPKAKITVKADTSTVNTTPIFVIDTKATDVSADTGVVPAQAKPLEKKDSTQVSATGQKDVGTKASGTVTLSIACASVVGSPPTIPAGSGVSAGGLTFITQSTTSLTTPSFSPCKFSGSTTVLAQQNGDKYNLAAGQTFSVAGYSSVTGSNGAAMSGGTSKIAKVVAQSDIDGAKQKMLDKNNDEAKSTLAKQFQDADYQAVLETFSPGTPAITNTPAVGEEADNITVNATINYTMMGVKKDDLKKVIDADVAKQIDTNKQPIQDYGFDKIIFQLLDGGKLPDQAKISLQTSVIAGVKLDVESLKQQVAGKKKGDIQQIIGALPGVKEVNVSYSPFWVSKTPKKISKITIILEQTNANTQP
jgi:hypothetical protein